MLGIKSRRIVLLAIIAFIALFALFALTLGSADISSPWRFIFHPSMQGNEHEIIWSIRFPRVLAALLVGLALGVSGALSQVATNNPLADPSIIGTSAGASLGAVLAVILNIASIGSVGVAIAAILGALLVSVATFSISKNALQLVIVGIAASSLVSAIAGLLISISNRDDARSISFWSLGSLALANMNTVHMLAPVVLAVSIYGWAISQRMDLLVLGDREVVHLGLNPRAIRFSAFIVISVLVATAVSAVGTIAFVALAAPHITRYLIGPTARPLIIGSGVIGAGILLVADTLARTVASPNELPIGLITSLIGAPILIFMLHRNSEVWK